MGKSHDEKNTNFFLDYEFNNISNMWDDDIKLKDFKKKRRTKYCSLYR